MRKIIKTVAVCASLIACVSFAGCGAQSSSGQAGDQAQVQAVRSVDISGVYQFSDFGEDCTQNCKLTVQATSDRIEVTMSDNFGQYPYWIGSVDGKAIAQKGKWVSKASTDSADVDKIESSAIKTNEPVLEFTYDKEAKAIDFEMQPAGKTLKVHATLME